MPNFHLTNVGLVDVGYHLHIVKVGDGEDVGNRHVGNDGLPDFHLARYHDAVDRSVDFGIAEILRGLHAVGLALLIGEARHVVFVSRRLIVVVAYQFLVVQLAVALIVCLAVFVGGARALKVGVGSLYLALEQGLVDFGYQLAFLYH